MYSFHILENYSKDMFHSSIIRFEKDSYLFNCCDGTQRNAMDQGIKFPKIKCIFFNSSHSNCYLGSYGFLMSRGEQNFTKAYSIAQNILSSGSKKKEKQNNKKSKPLLNQIFNGESKNPFENLQQCLLYGPPYFSENFKYSNNFCPVPTNKYLFEYEKNSNSFINKNNLSPSIKYYEDENITIIPICTNPEKNFEITDKNNYALSYICIPKQKNASFNKNKAIELGIKPGPLFGVLQKGNSITLEDGRIIKPEDVLEKKLPSSSILILYIPDFEHMNMLIKDETINKYLNNNLGNNYVYQTTIIVHITPKFDMINNENYLKFMSLFGKDVQHIIECPEINQQFLYNEGKIKIQILLNKVSDYLFPKNLFTEEESLPKIKNKSEIFNEISLKNNIKIDDSIPGRGYIIYPPEKRGIVIKGLYNGEGYFYKSENFKDFEQNTSNIKIKNIDNIINKNISIENSNNFPNVTFLGTTSMKPCKFRNVTSILIENNINNNEKKYIMFDCGEGTYQQMLEHYGNKKTENILLNIKLIAISHKHGDHMLGLIKIIKEIDFLLSSLNNNLLSDDYIYIIVPKTIIEFVKHSIELDIINKKYFNVLENNFFNINQEQIYQKYLILNNPYENFNDIPKLSPVDDYENLIKKINNFRNLPNLKNIYTDFMKKFGAYFNTIEVFHCDESYGFFLENGLNKNDENYWKISFSGDTRPNNNFFNYTMYSTLFIHEGTFDDDMLNDAKDKMHSTISEAINLGKNNMSKYIALTHFSPRYIKTYPFKEEFEEKKILLANDYLSFNLNDLDFAYKYLKPFDEVINFIEDNKNKKIKNIL